MSDWATFYVIVGPSGAALIGMQFVVMTLVAGRSQRPTEDALKAFATPTIVHLTGVLIVSALMTVPWRSPVVVAAGLAGCGIAGVAYSLIVIRRVHQQKDYPPVWQDWIWYSASPCAAYAALEFGAALMRSDMPMALSVTAAAVVGLLLVAIHNAWDTVTHIVVHDTDVT